MVGASTPGPALGEAIHVDRAIDRSAPRPALSDGSVVHAGAVRPWIWPSTAPVRGQPARGAPSRSRQRRTRSPSSGHARWWKRFLDSMAALQEPFRRGGVCGAVVPTRSAMLMQPVTSLPLTHPDLVADSPRLAVSPTKSSDQRRIMTLRWIATGTLRRCASRLSPSKDRRGQSRSRYLALREAIAGGQLAIAAAS
jgi:hypothetical protein